MKKLIPIILVFLIVSSTTFTSFASGFSYSTNYWSEDDVYRVDYSGISSNAIYVSLHYSNPNNGYAITKQFQNPTGAMYLTCNGQYKLTFEDSNQNEINTTVWIPTTEIRSQTCDSTQSNNTINDLNLRWNGSQLAWDDSAGVDHYEIWKDGQLVTTTTDQIFNVTDDGSYTVYAKDANGNTIGKSDAYKSGTVTNPPSTGENGSCNGCDILQDMIECPEWDTYMGDLSDAIRAALPPPPEWNNVADIFSSKIAPAVANEILNISPQMADIFAERWGDEFDEHMGHAPTPPSETDLHNQLDLPDSNLDTTVEEVDKLQPQIPFIGVQRFDLSDAPVIEVKDESKPFSLTDPLDNIDAKPPGQIIEPGDGGNSTGGIKLPDTIEKVEPIPTKIPSSEPSDPIPSPAPQSGEQPTPTPSQPDGDQQIPTPNQPSSEDPIPLPQPSDGFIEKKYYQDRPGGG